MTRTRRPPAPGRTAVRDALRDRRGVVLIEFALCLPILILLTLWVFEIVNYALVRQQVSQLALQVADNASRIGTQNSLQTRINEQQINDLFIGADLQSSSLDILQNGRIILSSLEVDPDKPHGQYIHWQRCYGKIPFGSSYGKEGDGKGVNWFPGMGKQGGVVRAVDGIPTMFVEVWYRYRPLISADFAPPPDFSEAAAMMVRDSRDTSDPPIDPVAGVLPSTCTQIP